MSNNWKTATIRDGRVTTTALERTASKAGYVREVAVLANELWTARGCPDGTADEDWFKAERQIGASIITDEATIGNRHFAEESVAHEEKGDTTAPRFRSELAQAPSAERQRVLGKIWANLLLPG